MKILERVTTYEKAPHFFTEIYTIKFNRDIIEKMGMDWDSDEYVYNTIKTKSNSAGGVFWNKYIYTHIYFDIDAEKLSCDKFKILASMSKIYIDLNHFSFKFKFEYARFGKKLENRSDKKMDKSDLFIECVNDVLNRLLNA